MRVFITGAAGFIGTATTRELLAHGHQVLGLARSDANAATLKSLGADIHPGSLENLDSLREGARLTDATIHLAFIHDFAKFAENSKIDHAAIEAMGDALAGTNKPFLVTSGTGLVAPGQLATESIRPPASPHIPRVSEQTCLAYATRGVRAIAIRLPQVHGAPGRAGLISYLVNSARDHRVIAYVTDGSQRWPAAHVRDVARLYRAALEAGATNAIYHAVAEPGIPMREIAETLSRSLELPIRAIPATEAPHYYGPLALFAGLDMPASSEKTQSDLNWIPTEIGLIQDIAQPGYFTP